MRKLSETPYHLPADSVLRDARLDTNIRNLCRSPASKLQHMFHSDDEAAEHKPGQTDRDIAEPSLQTRSAGLPNSRAFAGSI